MDQSLRHRREELERSWHAGVPGREPGANLRSEVVSSWSRSARSVMPDIEAAPVREPADVTSRFSDSRLGRASRVILQDLTDLAEGGDMMAALTDEEVTIAWLAGGRTMSRRADRVHFSLGGCWSEEAVGTNALAVAHRTQRPSAIFSAEHYAPMVHDWVCYSAPITDPVSGRFLGVLDLSTIWKKADPALLTTVSALARVVEYELAAMEPASGDAAARSPLVLRTLGASEAVVDGRRVPLTRRQLELLTVLSLHPDGLGLDELTGRVYGDQPISPSTVKAELSNLRHLLGGRVGSRPYRLVGPVDADFAQVLEALERNDVPGALSRYHGPMLAASDSPEVESWRQVLEVAVREAVLASAETEALFALGRIAPDDLEVHEATFARLAQGDGRRHLVAGRIAAAGGSTRAVPSSPSRPER